MDKEQLREEVQRLKAAGKSIRAMAAELNVTKGRVERALKALSRTPYGKTPSARGQPPSLDSLGSIFVGRQRETEALKDALNGALSLGGRVAMLVGEPGIGKTTTAREFAQYAESQGARVLWGRCYESVGTPSYWPWVQAIRAYVRAREPGRLRSEMGTGAADIAEIVPDVREQLPDLEPSPSLYSLEQARVRLFDSITSFLKRASQDQPLVVVLDNLHWADRPSLLLLEFLSQEMGEGRLLIVGTYRGEEVSPEHPLSRTLGELTKERYFHRIPLSGLAAEDVGVLIGLLSGITPDQSLSQAVYRHTQGNPLFVTEVVRLLAQEGELTGDRHWGSGGAGLGIPDGVREAIGRRLHRLSHRCNQLLTIASVIGREFRLNQLERLVPDFSGEELVKVLEEALAVRIIDELPHEVGHYQFTHVLVQETIASALSATRRARLHREIGQALEQLNANGIEGHAAELAHHFAQAGPEIAADKLVRYSLLAGEQALAAYAWEEALEHFQRGLAAREGQPVSAETAALLFGLSRAQGATRQSHQGREAFANLRRSFEYYLEAGDIGQAVTVAQYPIHAMAASHRPESLPIYTRALTLVPPNSREAGRLLARYGMALGMEGGDYDGSQQAFSQALAIARSYNDVFLEMRTLAESAYVNIFHLCFQECLEKSLQTIELAGRLNDLSTEVAARYWAYMSLRYMGNIEEAQRQGSAMLPLAERLRDRFWLASAFSTNEILARLAGFWTTARGFSDRGLEIAPHDVRLLSTRVLMEHELGNFDQGEVFLDRLMGLMRATPPTPTLVYSYPALIIPLVARITGKAEKLDVAETAANAVLSDPSAVPYNAVAARTGLALLKAYQGDVLAASEQYSALKPWKGVMVVGGCSLGTDQVLGLLARTTGKFDLAIAHFQDSLEMCRRDGYRPEYAWTCYDYAGTLLRRNGRGDHTRALALLEEALVISRQLGMRPLMERLLSLTQQARSQPGKGPEYVNGLTEREVQVLRLVVTGKTDREIAEELAISATTVSTHVRNILNKTNTANRTEATTYAARNGLI